MGAVSSKRIASEKGELEKRARGNLPSAPLNSNREAAFPVACEKITSAMTHTKSSLDVKKEKYSPSRELQKENWENKSRTSFFDKASPAAKQEQHLLHQRQSSDTKCDFPESRVEEGISSSKNQNEDKSDMLMQESNLLPVCHVIGDSSKMPKDEPAYLHLSRSSDLGDKTSLICDEERTTEKTEMVGSTSLPARSVNGAPASQSNEQMLVKTSQPGKVLEKLQPRRNPDAGGCSSQSDRVTTRSDHSEKNSVVPKAEYPQPDIPRPANHALMSKEEKVTVSKGESVSQDFIQTIGVPVHHPGQESHTFSTKSEKVEKLQPRRNPDPVVQESLDAGTTPSKAPEKGLDDGYNWRKYGQKLVKGNKFVRSYYKCTYSNCQAKKQVERSHDGCKSDINYLGNHHHQKPQHSPLVISPLQVITPETPIVSTSKSNAVVIFKHAELDQHMVPAETSTQSTVGRKADGLSGAVSCSNNDTRDLDDCPDSKRLKRDTNSVDEGVVNRSNPGTRHVVQTLSEVDLVNDGYRWRKYGQKLVKGNPNPRSYYRCSTAGCPVKKHVERASHDPKLVITTYEGNHDHDIPTSRTVSQSIDKDDANMMSPKSESSSKPEDTSPLSLEMAVHVRAN